MTTTLSGGTAFFAAVRPLFGGKLAQTQVDGINAIMDAWNLYGDGDDAKLSYILATAFLETGQTMEPVREAFGKSDADTKAKLTRAWKAGKLKVRKDYWSGGFFGRGLVQLTHEANYRKAGEALLLDLVGNPSLALDLVNAALILVKGMMEGWFTGKKLSDFIDANAADYKGARKIVNGTDRAQDIADYAETFEAAIRAARHVDPVPEPEPEPPAPEPQEPVPAAPAGFRPNWLKIGLWAAALVIIVLALT